MFAQHIPDEVKRRFYKNWTNAKKKAFTKYAERWNENDKSKNSIKRDIERMKKYCTVVRALCATQMNKLNLRQKKSHLFEIQVNGGTVAQKIDFVQSKFEQEISVSEIF